MKFLAELRVIVEAEDWYDAFDYLDELLRSDPVPVLSSMDTTVKDLSIDSLTRTRRVGLGTKGPRELRRGYRG